MRGYPLGIQIIVQAVGFTGAMPFYKLGKCVILEGVQPDKQMACSLHEFLSWGVWQRRGFLLGHSPCNTQTRRLQGAFQSLLPLLCNDK